MDLTEKKHENGQVEDHQPIEISKRLSVAEVLNRWPETVPVFIQYQTSCVGCYMSEFETLEDAARIYQIQLDAFLFDLNEAIEKKGK